MKTLLVPVDFSSNSQKALRFALDFAQAANMKVHVMHQITLMEVVPDNAFTGFYMPMAPLQIQYAEEELQKFVNKTRQNIKGKHTITTSVEPGVGTADVILEVAKNQKADLIVLGTRGASGLKKFFLGSNAARVVERSQIPVITIPHTFRRKEIKKIGYASDLANIQAELKALMPVANAIGATTEIFHVAPSFPPNKYYDAFQPEKALADLNKALKPATPFTYKLVITKEDNDFYGGVNRYIRTAKPDMVCMVAHKRGWVAKLIQPSKSKALTYYLKIPVLCIKAN